VLLLSNTDWLSEGLDQNEIHLMLDLHGPRARYVMDGAYVSHCSGSLNAGSASTLSIHRLIRNRTFFALGVLLIELCLVRNDAGKQYRYVVQRCLRCDFPGRDDEQDFGCAEFRMEFF
jgi:hypothetical protein